MVDVTVFGSGGDSRENEGCSCGCGCGHAHSMRDAAEVLEKELIEKFGDQVSFRYVDVFSEDIMDFPDVVKVMNQFRLPLTVLNGEPRFHGGLSFEKISAAVAELLGEG
jgi:disulfide oxidoreductase YuzD